MYHTEKQLVDALPKMAKSARNEDLRQAFLDHVKETKAQVSRLEAIFNHLGEEATSEKNKSIEGLVADAENYVKAGGDQDSVDAALIFAAQKAEHLEIASYGTLIAFAKELGFVTDVQLLETSLAEEKNTDKKLTQIAVGGKVNHEALSESGYRKKSSGFSWGTLFLLAGAGAAIYYLAPQLDKDTKENLNKFLNNVLGSVKEGSEKVKASVESTSRDVAENVKSVSNDLRSKTEEVVNKYRN